jgi:hypothetical protein
MSKLDFSPNDLGMLIINSKLYELNSRYVGEENFLSVEYKINLLLFESRSDLFFNVPNMVSDNCFLEGTIMVLSVLLNVFS